MYSIVFVCTGNTCRSPMAEGIARASALGDRVDFRFSSVGLAAGVGQPASAQAREIAARHGFDLDAHRAASLDPETSDAADLLLTMTRAHRDAIVAAQPALSERTLTLGEAAGRDGEDIADPYGGSLEDYEESYQQIERLLAAAEPFLIRLATTRVGGESADG